MLHRHEAYVRRQEAVIANADRNETLLHESKEKVASLTSANSQLVAKMAELVREHATLDKRLTQALLNLEITDSSNRALLHELQESRSVVARLSAQSARSTGWEARLRTLEQERDDINEERKAQSARARTAETKSAALTEQCGALLPASFDRLLNLFLAKLQAQLNNLREERDAFRLSRTEISDEILREARLRLEALQQSAAQNTESHEKEFVQMLESLASENEALKHGSAELQNLLNESREEIRTLREEVEEHRAASASPLPGQSGDGTTWSLNAETARFQRTHRSNASWAGYVPSARRSSFGTRVPIARAHSPNYSISRKSINRAPRSPSTEPSEDRTLIHVEDLTLDLEACKRPVSPALSSPPAASSLRPYAPSSLSMELEFAEAESWVNGTPTTPPKARPKPLYLLSRSKGVQTDPVIIIPASPGPSTLSEPSTEPRSETSSIQEGNGRIMTNLLDRISNSLTKLTQTDVRTLTNRLKRQHIVGADVGHISRTSITAIVNEVATLRSQFRSMLEDDKAATSVNRKEFRTLIKLFNDMFAEMGQLRASVNEVVLDPSVGTKLREEALAEGGVDKSKSGGLDIQSWIAPLSKLFTGASTQNSPLPQTSNVLSLSSKKSTLGRVSGPNLASPVPTRLAAKLAPAVSASTTTVNVEFGGNAAVRRAVSTTLEGPIPVRTNSTTPQPVVKKQLFGIFAGAPKKPAGKLGGWVVLPSGVVPKSPIAPGSMDTPPVARQGRRVFNNPRRLSRVVDAVVDADVASIASHSSREEDPEHPQDDNGHHHGRHPTGLLERTLRRRGLSDSSMHSTFLTAARGPPIQRLVTPAGLALCPTDMGHAMGSAIPGSVSDRENMLETLGRQMGGLRNTAQVSSLQGLLDPDGAGDQQSAIPVTTSRGSTCPNTPSSATRVLPSHDNQQRSPPKPIPPTSKDKGHRQTAGGKSSSSLSPRPRATHGNKPRTADDSHSSGGFLPSLAAWTNPLEADLLEEDDDGFSGSYTASTRLHGALDDGTIGRRTFTRRPV